MTSMKSLAKNRQLLVSAARSRTTTRCMASVGLHTTDNHDAASESPSWSGQLSFTSPETDFTAANVPVAVAAEQASPKWSEQLSFSSPESDFTAQNVAPAVEQSLQDRSFLIHHHRGWSIPFLSSDDTNAKIPKTFKEALLDHHKAIVVTTATAPHTILYVNKVWEQMCGYKQNEVLDKTLSCIQGKDTNVPLATSLVAKVANHEQEEPIDMYLINYKKDGSPFTNHLTVGTMALNEQVKDVEFIVGVLEEVDRDQVPLRMVGF